MTKIMAHILLWYPLSVREDMRSIRLLVIRLILVGKLINENMPDVSSVNRADKFRDPIPCKPDYHRT